MGARELMLLVTALVFAPTAAVAQQRSSADRDEAAEHEHIVGLDEVNRLVGSGIIRPLSTVVGAAQKLSPGQLIDANLMLRRGRYVYEIEMLRGSRRDEIYVDAVTLDIRGRE